MRSFLTTLLVLLGLVGPVEALDLRVGGVTMVVAGTCITLTPSTGLGAVTISTCQDLSTTGNPTFASLTLNGSLTEVNGVTAQEIIIYNTFTDASNYERARIGWVEAAGKFRISTGKAGTGATRDIELQAGDGNINFSFGTTVSAWEFLASTNALVPTASDNNFDVGSSAKRIRTLYAGTSVTSSGNVTCCTSTPTAVTNIRVYAPSLTPANTAAAIGASTQTFTVTGLTTADKVFVNGPASTALCPLTGHARVSGADTLELEWVDLTVALCTPAAGTYTIFAIRS